MTKYMILILMVLVSKAHAEASPELMKGLEDHLARLDQSLAISDTSDQNENEVWFLKNFWLRAKLQFGFEIPGFAKMLVVPETEFLFQRQNPDGWSSYKP